jgi:hypothetical protein
MKVPPFPHPSFESAAKLAQVIVRFKSRIFRWVGVGFLFLVIIGVIGTVWYFLFYTPRPILAPFRPDDRILIITPTAGTAIRNAGELLYQAAANGSPVFVVVVASPGNLSPEALADENSYREPLIALQELGVPASRVIFFNVPLDRVAELPEDLAPARFTAAFDTSQANSFHALIKPPVDQRTLEIALRSAFEAIRPHYLLLPSTQSGDTASKAIGRQVAALKLSTPQNKHRSLTFQSSSTCVLPQPFRLANHVVVAKAEQLSESTRIIVPQPEAKQAVARALNSFHPSVKGISSPCSFGKEQATWVKKDP